MKYFLLGRDSSQKRVTPFVGVWIEISSHKSNNVFCFVTPFVGVWIEINKTVLSALSFSVTPFVGVWIEILPDTTPLSLIAGHSLRGSVD